ncbi:MAG: hypothetical protein QNK04_18540 [Myxococcota bacterium]|nr:hypothetical protein [Myxococcota bacterium]
MTLSLMDALGVIVAFITVILVLSMVVTALVQVAQSILRTRGRNLQKALVELLMRELHHGEGDAKETARKILGSTWASLLKRDSKKSTGRWGQVLGPAVSWIEPDEIEGAVARAGVRMGKTDRERIARGLGQMQRPMDKRLGFVMRGISIVFAVLVAVVFQVSSIELLSSLSEDAELREKLIADAGKRLEAGLETVDERALDQLRRKNPEAREKLEGAGDFPQPGTPMRLQLEALFGAGDEGKAILEAYDAERSAAVDALRADLAELAPLNIAIWKRDDFYRDSRGIRWVNVAGVGITALLLSFGAPFWFKQLQVVVGLRDALKPEKGADPGRGPATGGDASPGGVG